MQNQQTREFIYHLDNFMCVAKDLLSSWEDCQFELKNPEAGYPFPLSFDKVYHDIRKWRDEQINLNR